MTQRISKAFLVCGLFCVETSMWQNSPRKEGRLWRAVIFEGNRGVVNERKAIFPSRCLELWCGMAGSSVPQSSDAEGRHCPRADCWQPGAPWSQQLGAVTAPAWCQREPLPPSCSLPFGSALLWTPDGCRLPPLMWLRSDGSQQLLQRAVRLSFINRHMQMPTEVAESPRWSFLKSECSPNLWCRCRRSLCRTASVQAFTWCFELAFFLPFLLLCLTDCPG